MEVRSVDPRHASEEINSPANRVDCCGPTGAADGDVGATIADKNLLTGGRRRPRDEVLSWAVSLAQGREVMVYAVYLVQASSAARDVSPSQGTVWAGNRKPRLKGQRLLSVSAARADSRDFMRRWAFLGDASR
jgi:hypothetical protein